MSDGISLHFTGGVFVVEEDGTERRPTRDEYDLLIDWLMDDASALEGVGVCVSDDQVDLDYWIPGGAP